MRGVALLLAFALVAAACGHAKPRLGTTSDELLAHADELGHEGQASLAIVRETGDKRENAGSRNVMLDQQVRFRGATTSLMLLMRGCPPFVGTQPCPLAPRDGELVYLVNNKLTTLGANPRDDYGQLGEVENDAEYDEVRVVFGLLSLASFTGMGLCIWQCEDSRTGKSVALGGGGLLFGLIWMVMSGDVHD